MSKKNKRGFGQASNKNKWQEVVEQEEALDESEDDDEPSISLDGIGFPDRQSLEDQLTAFEQKADKYKAEAIRSQAEMENLRKRTEREVANAIKFGSERLIVDLLPVVDSLVRGLESPESQDSHAKSMRQGMALTLDLLNKTLVKHGVEIIDPASGDAFDPESHEAMSTQPAEGAAPNSIVQVIQKGYRLNGRVLRAAMVIVAS